MKTILVPTDFSEAASNALNYAAELASRTNSKLLLFHAYYIPVLVSDDPFVISGEDFQIEENSYKQMKIIIEGLQRKYENKLAVDYISQQGFTTGTIAETAKEKNCDLIVMGTKGNAGLNKLFGSNTADVIKHTQAHVLVIPDKIKFQKIDKIVFAFDYDAVKNSVVFNPLIELAALFNSEILIFNMRDGRVHPELYTADEGISLDQAFENIRHTYWFSNHENIIKTINEFADEKKAVMITMIRRHHNLFQQIFSQSDTKQMALHAHIPLLILHEQT